jgi:alpha,alpha-trehalase
MIKLSLPEEVLMPLFQEVAMAGVIPDGKSWADALPKRDVGSILMAYEIEKDKSSFNLGEFVEKNFAFTAARSDTFVSDVNISVTDHINRLWPYLTRAGDNYVEGSSLIPLPHPYVVPGGRFNEIYYWDSYFTMLGLKVSGKHELIRSMVDNFAWLIKEVGFIPNGNRTYFLSRSQPPFFSLMVSLLADLDGENTYLRYKNELLLEYQFWMEGVKVDDAQANKHIVFLGNNQVLNRYYDMLQTPRSEMYAEDVHLAQNVEDHEAFYRHIRAACESGWDFSSRWCADAIDLLTISTNDIIPVDLNCLLYHLELTLAKVMDLEGAKAEYYLHKANNRKNLILQYCWDEGIGYFFDYHHKKMNKTASVHAAGIFPLFVGIADEHQANQAMTFLSENLLTDGGVLTTNLVTGQQWDAPNGWAPLQWIAVEACLNYGNKTLAHTIISRWTSLNEKVFKETGKMLEKYNVVDLGKTGGGGEYPVQDGFGWTNGVYLAMKAALHK